ncbi:Hydroxymethylpyrimidine/phosphomethylpyrimidine kinase 2-like protein [Elsinoe fawcettii]|nr:Hydroxymethylpyrimidine/phosphomethylpyrimidine kinase 2-like protein [Elsinoe fawcettii]
MTATTALTAQNTLGVSDIHRIPSEFVAKQIEACASDVGVDVVKTGMLASADTIKVVANALKKYSITKSVVDPVMVATSGARLLPEDAIKTLISDLLPHTYLLTPNVPEAVLILKETGKDPGSVTTLDDLKRLAQDLSTLGPTNILLKGGHLPLPSSTDPSTKLIHNILYTTCSGTHHVFTSPHLSSPNTHGTGCSLASAIASNLAMSPSSPIENLISTSLDYISHCIATSLPIGSGSGPINHLSLIRPLPFIPGAFITYLLHHPLIAPLWHRFTHHPFLSALADSSLPLQSYKHYMTQDFLYLTHFARANALASYKASTLSQVAASAEIVLHIQRETALHVAACEALGVDKEALDAAEEDQATVAYSRFILDTGHQGDWFGLQVAMGPCLVGYGVAATRLWEEASAGGEGIRDGQGGEGKAGEHYAKWIANYVAEDYREAVRKGRALIEEYAVRQSPERIEELVRIWAAATKMEIGFWDSALNAGEA